MLKFNVRKLYLIITVWLTILNSVEIPTEWCLINQYTLILLLCLKYNNKNTLYI